MRKILLSTVAALSVVGFAGVASAQNFEGVTFFANDDGSLALDQEGNPRVENVIEGTIEFPDMGEAACTVCDRFEIVEGLANKAMNKGYDAINVQFKNTAYGDIKVGSGSGILDQDKFSLTKDLEVSAQAMAGVQANVWEVSDKGLNKVTDGQIPNTALNVQYTNYAGGSIKAPDGIAEELDGNDAARNVTISSTALAGVQANIVRAGNVALRNK